MSDHCGHFSHYRRVLLPITKVDRRSRTPHPLTYPSHSLPIPLPYLPPVYPSSTFIAPPAMHTWLKLVPQVFFLLHVFLFRFLFFPSNSSPCFSSLFFIVISSYSPFYFVPRFTSFSSSSSLPNLYPLSLPYHYRHLLLLPFYFVPLFTSLFFSSPLLPLRRFSVLLLHLLSLP